MLSNATLENKTVSAGALDSDCVARVGTEPSWPMAPQRCRAGTRSIASVLLFVALLTLVNLVRRLDVTPKRNSGERYREESATARAHVAQRLAAGERFITFKELTINNGLSNAYNALRSALAIASLTNRTLILPRYFSRHLRSEPYDVDAGYFFDEDALRKRFRVEAASLIAHAFPNAMTWPPLPPLRVHWIQLQEGEQLCGECSDSAKMESLGLVTSTCPPLALRGEQARAQPPGRAPCGFACDSTHTLTHTHTHTHTHTE